MTHLATYRNDRPYGFCPGCSHRLVVEALDRALVRMQWDPADIVIVTDIGCVGLSDQYFITSAFHGLHGRSLTYATGIKLARPDLHVINLIGDGGCGIGCTHLVNAARRNIGVTTLVFNNLNFGMTGGEHSATTPLNRRTTTTPWGNVELPLDIAQTAAVNGATYVWRGTAFDADLDGRIVEALCHAGFALLDIWELCVAYYATANKVGPKDLDAQIEQLGFERGLIRQTRRQEGAAALREASASRLGEPASLSDAIEPRFEPRLDRPYGLIIAGSAGAHIRTAGRLVATAAALSDLHSTQRDDYPVTVRVGHSVSELLLSPEPIAFTGITRPNVVFVLSPEGLDKVQREIAAMTEEDWLYVVPSLAGRVVTRAQVALLHLEALQGVARAATALAAVAAGLGNLGILDPEALIESAARLNPDYAQSNQHAVRTALALVNEVIVPEPSAGSGAG